MNRQQKVHLALFVLWATVGAACSVIWLNSVPWVVFMSIYAILAAHGAGFSGATDNTEKEKPDGG